MLSLDSQAPILNAADGHTIEDSVESPCLSENLISKQAH